MNVWDELRMLRKMVADLQRKVATLIMTGTVETTQGSKARVVFDDAGADGQPFRSPMIPQASSSGHKGGGASMFTRLGTGEPVLVFSPGGELGDHSRILPGGPVTDHPSPGAAETDGSVFQLGPFKWRNVDGVTEFLNDDFRFTGNVTIDGNVETNGTLRNNGVNVGSTHVHGGVETGAAKTQTPDP